MKEENANLLGEQPRVKKTSKSRLAVRIIAALAFGIYAFRLSGLTQDIWGSHDEEPNKDWTFDEIVPNEKLDWKPCYDKFYCAKLKVPMDYHRPLNKSGSPEVHVALAMLPAKGHGGPHWSKTPMMFNPGGPGGPGVGFLLGAGEKLRGIVGDHYDLVSFDPRGIGLTKPSADCFSYPSSGTNPSMEDKHEGLFHRFLYSIQGTMMGIANSSDRALLEMDTRNRALAATCAEKDDLKGDDSIFRHVSTPNVARDMVSIIDAWNDWREDTLSRYEPQPIRCSRGSKRGDDHSEGKLVYWGFSYGTLLGATFAAMFPDRVHRVILDGVVDADHYVAPVWSESIENADDILDQFAYYCHKAGPECSFFRHGDSKLDIDQKGKLVLARLKEQPLYGVSQATHTPVTLEYAQIKFVIFSFLYAPIQGFRILGMLLDLINQAQETGKIPQNLMFPFVGASYQPFCAKDVSYMLSSGAMEAQQAIMCADKRYALNESIAGLEERFEKLATYSSFADVWMTLMDSCSGWAIPARDPPMRWDDHPSKKPKPIETNFPILFLSNTLDPVTPLRAGHLMARKFVDAGLVELKTQGHCTLAAASKCITRKIRAYFNEGEVPHAPGDWESGDWDTCEADETPWNSFVSSSSSSSDDILEDAMIAWKELQRDTFKSGDFGYGRAKMPKLDVSLMELVN